MLNSHQESPVTAPKPILDIANRYDVLYLDILRLHGLIMAAQHIIDDNPSLHQATREFAALQAVIESADVLAGNMGREGGILNDMVGDLVATCHCEPLETGDKEASAA